MSNKIITVEDCDALWCRFEKYTETAEQHEFPLLAMIHYKLVQSLNAIHEAGFVADQEEARAMFRTVLMVIGGDTSEYEEDVK